jgi:hypothetical protein
MLPGAASATDSKEFKRVKQKIEASLAFFGHFNIVDWAVIQRFGDAAINASEMVPVPFDRGIESFTAGQVSAAHQTPLMQLTEIAIYRREPHGVVFVQAPVQLLSTDFVMARLQCP